MVLEGYESIVPGAADRILAMAEKNNDYLNEMDKEALRSGYAERRLGQIFALVIALFALSVSVVLAYTGNETTASIVGGSTVVGLVSIFVVGRIFGKPE